ncbi:MAG TPA: hypothetical protein VEZ14_15305, partial [Dehalococcoidia bacterium]|nr:hypothetical protein [Dehalococcoidia bacterium]
MDAELTRVLERMDAERRRLVAVVAPLSAEDLGRGRPGGWTLGRVLHHVIEAEAIYTKLLAHQR